MIDYYSLDLKETLYVAKDDFIHGDLDHLTVARLYLQTASRKQTPTFGLQGVPLQKVQL